MPCWIGRCRRRFDAYPPFQATEMLLHERISEAPPVSPLSAEIPGRRDSAAGQEVLMRVFNIAAHADPGSASAIERALSRHDHQRRRRL